MSARRPESQSERAQAFGQRIRAIRREARLTQKQVAVEIPMSPGNLSRIENGDYGPPSDEVIERLATVLGADLIDLMRTAGRSLGRQSFEDEVLAQLEALRRELAEGLDSLKAQISDR